MGPMYWKPQSRFRLQKCNEFKVGPCNAETDDCCGVIPCRYCITFVGVYDTYYGVATFVDNGWLGTINGSTFFAYWERDYETGECNFVVLIDSLEVYRRSCYEGQSCRDSSDSVSATIGDEYGTLSWTKHELRPLEYVIDPETGCRIHFCGSCECVCPCLCVTIIEPIAEGGTAYQGEICDDSYPCDGPVWSGMVGPHYVDIAMTRNAYGDCVLGGSFDGEELDEVPVTDCTAIAATWTLYDGTEITVECKVCNCPEPAGCTGCCFPEGGAPIPFEIDAPGCSIDGFTDEFVEEAIDPTPQPCGLCGSYVLSTAFSVPGQIWNPDGMGGCDLIPACAITFCLRLICDGEAHGESDTPGGGECCKKLRLLVSVPYEFEGGVIGDGGLTCLGGDSIWHGYVAAESCSCEGGLSAIFSLAKFVPKATDATCPPGLVQPCVPDCDMSLLRIVI